MRNGDHFPFRGGGRENALRFIEGYARQVEIVGLVVGRCIVLPGIAEADAGDEHLPIFIPDQLVISDVGMGEGGISIGAGDRNGRTIIFAEGLEKVRLEKKQGQDQKRKENMPGHSVRIERLGSAVKPRK